jgi:amino acid adenylation domain-containing protein
MGESQDNTSNARYRATSSIQQRIADLSPQKREVLQKKLLEKRKVHYSPIRPNPNQVEFPLSFNQRRLWFIEQLFVGKPLYNITRAIRIRGPLNLDALRSSLQTLVARHEALRTTYHWADGEPVQRIRSPQPLQMSLVDLCAGESDPQEIEQRLKNGLTTEGKRVFNLSEDLMLRAVLYQITGDEVVLQLTIHHLSCDGWSLQILFSELASLYRAFSTGQAVEPTTHSIRYGDFACWQREPRQQQVYAERLKWWTAQLAGAPTTMELATDGPRPRMESGVGAIQPFAISADTLDQLRTIGRDEDATLYTVLLTGFFILLHRYTGMEDFVVGSAIAGRNHPDTQSLVGFFVDTVALRADLSGNPTARQLLQRVRQTVLEAVQHSELPFDQLVSGLGLPRNLDRHPLFQIIFNTPPQYSVELHNLEVLPINVDLGISRFDLEMTYAAGANRTTGLTWSTDLFTADTVKRMANHYCAVLKAMTTNVDQPVYQLPLLSQGERRQLLIEWNGVSSEYPRDRSIHELFEEQATQSPDSVAVVFQDQQLTYRQLNERANQLAHLLRSMGVGPGSLVGVCLERSADLIVTILAILKAGGAYLPLNEDDPPRRLAFILRDAAVDLVVTKQQWADCLPKSACRAVCLDFEASSFASRKTSNLAIGCSPADLAYVMFTSGSTGHAKGVEIQHRSVIRLVLGNHYATFGSDRVFLQLAQPSFDASTFEVWGALLHGAKLVVAPAGLPDFQDLQSLIRQHEVTSLWLTATLFNQIIEQYPQAIIGIKEIITGGESLSVRHVCMAQERLGPEVQLVNGYGPTESTTFATCYRIPPGTARNQSSIPIGRPIANTQVYVLDEHRQLVPIGVPGELYIGGDGVAQGYRNRKELTSERFVEHSLFEDSAGRLYRTGDRVRWRADGNLEFLGRFDDQIKLRGFRIEPGEIQSVLNEHPDIAQSVVTLREDQSGDKRLAAYYVCKPGRTAGVSQLRRHLQLQLPDYMVPAAFVPLTTIPLTSSGKVDRQSLPVPDESRPSLETKYVAARSTVEQKLVSIWSDLLGVEQIGVHDNFFALGGHSLLTARLVAIIAKEFDRKLPLAVVFQHGTISEIAKLIVNPEVSDHAAKVIPLIPGGEERPIYLMPGMVGEMMGSLARKLGEEAHGRFPILGVQPALISDHLEVFSDFNRTAISFADALRRHQPRGPYALAGYSFGGMMAFEVARVLSEMGEEVDLLAILDTGPGWRGVSPTLRDYLVRMSRSVANLPGWVRKEARGFSTLRFCDRVLRKLRRWYRIAVSGGKAKPVLGDVFATGHVAELDRAIMESAFAAFQHYEPQSFAGRLTLFRANVRPLFRGCSPDIGWSRYVDDLEIHHVDGNHVSILSSPHIDQVARQIVQLMNKRK